MLTREGEVALARRIECGQLVVMKTITRSPIVVKELISVAAALRRGERSIKEVVQFPDEGITEEKIDSKTRQTLRQMDFVARLYATALRQAQEFPPPRNRKNKHTFVPSGRWLERASRFLLQSAKSLSIG